MVPSPPAPANPTAEADEATGVAPLAPVEAASSPELNEAVESLEQIFRQPFSLVNLASSRVERVSADWLGGDLFSRLGLCEELSRRGRVEAIEDCAPLLVLGVPLTIDGDPTDLVAVSTFLTQSVDSEEEIAAAAAALEVSPERAFRWSRGRQPWPPHAVVELGKAWHGQQVANQRNRTVKSQLTDVSAHLLSTFEELSMLHRLTERLSISSSESELCGLALQWLSDIVPAESIVVMLETSPSDHPADDDPSTEVLTWGKRLIDESEYPTFIQRLGPDAPRRCLVLNRDRTSSPTWCYPDVNEAISVPIRTGDKVLGWLLALNFTATDGTDDEFGTIEASLLSSVAAILGVHAGNMDLYREQSEFFESVIRALSSAIDAKDPYTCGHSDRVARIAVCLGKELGCTTSELNTIYLSGLLHDIGKIGINDTVLRKPGALTKAEYEHIKTHPELGRRILAGVRQLDNVLPVVLHHHEAWDGGGYPSGLVAEQCPKLARIVAVADSIDAMGSDRPYRKGMPVERLDSILSAGAGRQWDPEVIDAYFAVRDQIREIAATERASLGLDVCQWDAQSAAKRSVT